MWRGGVGKLWDSTISCINNSRAACTPEASEVRQGSGLGCLEGKVHD